MTIDELYEAFMDKDVSFAEDIYQFMDYKMEDRGWDPESWAKEYGMYIPTFDPAGIKLGERERDIDYDKAMDVLNLTQTATDRIYNTELDTLSTELGREMSKGRAVAGKTGIRSGALEGAVEDTMKIAGDKTKDLGDRLMISETEMKDKYNATMVDTALDFDKTKRREKEEFYNRTMAAIIRLTDKGAFEQRPCPEGHTRCPNQSCAPTPEECSDYVVPEGLEGIQEGMKADWETLKEEFDNCTSGWSSDTRDDCWNAFKAGADALNTDPLEIINWAFPDLKEDYEWWKEGLIDWSEEQFSDENLPEAGDRWKCNAYRACIIPCLLLPDVKVFGYSPQSICKSKCPGGDNC